jgi:hypothetical protein
VDDGEEVVRSYLTFSAEPDPRLLDYFGPDVQAFQCKSGRGFTFRLDPTTDTWSDEWGIKCRRPPGGHYYDPYEYPLAAADSIADVERFPFPDPSDPSRLAGVTEVIRQPPVPLQPPSKLEKTQIRHKKKMGIQAVRA